MFRKCFQTLIREKFEDDYISEQLIPPAVTEVTDYLKGDNKIPYFFVINTVDDIVIARWVDTRATQQ
jgi:hypothetical protein